MLEVLWWKRLIGGLKLFKPLFGGKKKNSPHPGLWFTFIKRLTALSQRERDWVINNYVYFRKLICPSPSGRRLLNSEHCIKNKLDEGGSCTLLGEGR